MIALMVMMVVVFVRGHFVIAGETTSCFPVGGVPWCLDHDCTFYSPCCGGYGILRVQAQKGCFPLPVFQGK